MIDVRVNYAGLKLSNPIIVAPAGITATVERMKRAQEYGAGAVVVKSLFEKEIARINPSPRFKILRQRLNGLSSFILYSYEQASEYGPERYAQEINRAKRELEIPVIASINCITPEGWVSYSRLVEEAGADALELNLSCPHGPLVMSEQDVNQEMVVTTQRVKNQVKIPVIPKMTPQATNPLAVAKNLEEVGADALVVFNRFTGLDIDIESQKPIMHGGYAGHGGPWSIHYSLRWISAFFPVLKIPLSGSGGVTTGEDVVKYLLAGATTVQVCSAVILEGYQIINRLREGLINFMERKGYSRVDEFRGKAANRILGLEEVDRRHLVAAVIDSNQCNGCGICQQVCFCRAIHFLPESSAEGCGRHKVYSVRIELCDGCGLCSELCPQKAISLINKYE